MCLTFITKQQKNKREFSDSGVKKLFVISLVGDVPETFNNVTKIWKLLRLNDMSEFSGKITIATDLKLAGIMSHSATHPCTWCDIEKTNLQQKGQQRTISNITSNFIEWKKKVQDLQKQKNI